MVAIKNKRIAYILRRSMKVVCDPGEHVFLEICWQARESFFCCNVIWSWKESIETSCLMIWLLLFQACFVLKVTINKFKPQSIAQRCHQTREKAAQSKSWKIIMPKKITRQQSIPCTRNVRSNKITRLWSRGWKKMGLHTISLSITK